MYTKIKWTLIIIIMWICTFAAWDIRQNNIKAISSANAGIWDDIKSAITGHANDIKDRIFTDDELLLGAKIKESKFEFTKDSLHWAKGTVRLEYYPNDYYIQLGSDFEAGLAPDLYIVLSDKVITNQTQLDLAPKATLYKLKKGKGATYYKVPSNLKVKTIVIWCKRFNQFMGSAVL